MQRYRKIETLHKKIKSWIKGFFSKSDQIRSSLRIWSHSLKKSLMENFIFMQWELYLGTCQISMMEGFSTIFAKDFYHKYLAGSKHASNSICEILDITT